MHSFHAILASIAYAEVQYLDAESLLTHPVFQKHGQTEMPKISPTGCYQPVSGSFDKRLEPFDHGDEEFLDGFELVKSIPDTFDIRNVNGINMATQQQQQHIPVYCGGCWAFGTTSALADRFKYMRKAAWPDVNLSTQGLLNCGKFAGTCTKGGADSLVYRYAKEFGFVDETCLNTVGQSLPCSDITRCMNCDPPDAANGWVHGKCYPNPRYQTYHVKAYSHLPVHRDEAPDMTEQMKAEIYARGPISCQIAASPMENYLSGVLRTSPKDSGDIDHVVSVSGWDVDEETGEEYWIVRNSWGLTWGENGWFRVQMHENALNLESGCTFGVPEWPPRVYEVSPERMIFTNGISTSIPAWLEIMDESAKEYEEGTETASKESIIQRKVAEQKNAMVRPNPIGGFAFKVDEASGIGYTEIDYQDVHNTKWVLDHGHEL